MIALSAHSEHYTETFVPNEPQNTYVSIGQANFMSNDTYDDEEVDILSIECDVVISLQHDSNDSNDTLAERAEVDKIIEIQDLDNKPKSLEVLIRYFKSIISFTVDTGSPTNFINKAAAESLLRGKSSNAVVKNIKDINLRMKFIDFNKKRIEILGALFVDVKSAGWKVQRARFLIVEKKPSILRMDLQGKIGIVTK